MGLSSSLQIGRSGLLASQTGIEVTGNNLANITTRGYHRQSVSLSPGKSHELQRGIFLGQGVEVQQVLRHVDEALEGRIRGGIADQAYSQTSLELLSQIEAVHNELTDIDLSSQLSAFFNEFGALAANQGDPGQRSLVIQAGQSLSSFVTNLRSNLVDQLKQLDKTIGNQAIAANDLLDQLASINLVISKAEKGAGGAFGLRDERDSLLAELSQYMDISTIEQSSGSIDIYVGSLPVLLNNTNRGVMLRQTTVNNQPQIDLVIKDDNSVLQITSGSLAALENGRQQDVDNAITVLDNFVSQLIFQVNRIHSQGQNFQNPDFPDVAGVQAVTGTAQASDPNAVLNDPLAGLAFTPQHGSFKLHLTQESTGQRDTTQINIDLDGITPASDTTLTSLAASINAVANVTASVTADGRLQITANNNFKVSFSEDSSDVLATLGINTFFSGSNATDIDVNATLGSINAALDHISGDNTNAEALAGLRDLSISGPPINGVSLTEFWNNHIQDYAVRTGQAQQQLEADTIVRDNLEAQQQSVSGVNADEEAINLLIYQRAYQGSARFLSVVDELIQTLLNLL